MSSSDNNTSPPPPPLPEPAIANRRKFALGSRGRAAALSVSLLVIGAIAGAGALRLAGGMQPQAAFVLQPSPIASMSEWTPAAIKGQVAEVFGNKFIVADASGRALVETGREGEGGRLVKPNETVTVQGRFERGFLHASVIEHEDGHADLVGPPKGPHPHGAIAWLRSVARP
jgi:uncharacterized protein YdeI (BOF family)